MQSVRFLGIGLDSELNWKCHIGDLSTGLSKTIFALYKLTNAVGQRAAKIAYHSLFHSKMSYAIVAWGNSVGASKIFIIQKRAIRIINKLPHGEPCKEHFIRNKIMSFPSTFIYNTLLYIHKNKSKYITRSDVHTHNTRFACKLDEPIYKLTKFKRNSLQLSIYNKLPDSFTKLSINSFKKNIKRLLLLRCYYSIDEYLTDTI